MHRLGTRSFVHPIEHPCLQPGKLFGGPYPYSPQHKKELIEKCAIEVILNLTEYPYHSQEAQTFQRRNICVLHLPIQDFGIPSSIEELYDVLSRIDSLISEGKHVYIHCQGGRGRTGMITACLAVHSCLLPPEKAVRFIRECISGAIETDEQKRFVSSYFRFLNSKNHPSLAIKESDSSSFSREETPLPRPPSRREDLFSPLWERGRSLPPFGEEETSSSSSAVEVGSLPSSLSDEEEVPPPLQREERPLSSHWFLPSGLLED